MIGRIAAGLAVLLTVGGCAFSGGSAAMRRENRPLDSWPWVYGGTTPTPGDIQGAMGFLYREWLGASCPFSLLTCDRNNPRLAAGVVTVTGVRCAYADWNSERCGFRMTETVAGKPPAHSRCRAVLRLVGTAHTPPVWEVNPFDEPPRINCTRTR